MEEIIGTGNRIIDVDLTRGETTVFTVPEAVRRDYLGGKGLGVYYLAHRLTPETDPLGPENILAVFTGVIMATGAPCSGRFAAVTRSPLTGILGGASCGGPFGMALKTAGYDGLLITGGSETPVTIRIDKDGVEIRPAEALWGLDTAEAQAALNLEKRAGALVIGPAGENRVRYANIRSGHRFFGRTGMGAVMGSKRLKAVVAVGGTHRIRPAQPKRFRRLVRRCTADINAHPMTSHHYREHGTAATVSFVNRTGVLPVRNFRLGHHPDAEAVSGEAMAARYGSRPSTCKPCAIRCGHKGTDRDGVERQIPEYETVGLLGPNLGIFDPDRLMEWNDLCGRLGMDTISAGATLGFVMEAGERGLMETGLAFGEPDGVPEALRSIARREGIGDDLANGVRWLSEKHGGADFAIHVKGLELAAYNPRGTAGQGLAYAVANRGGCHLSAYMVAMEVLFGLLSPRGASGKAVYVRFLEDLSAGINALHICQFTMYAFLFERPLVKWTPKPILSTLMRTLPAAAVALIDFTPYPRLWSAVTGIPLSARDFRRAGERINVLERYINTRMGISRKDDTLPPRCLASDGDLEGRPVPLDRMLDDYYRGRGYDENGVPRPETLRRLEILPDDLLKGMSPDGSRKNAQLADGTAGFP